MQVDLHGLGREEAILVLENHLLSFLNLVHAGPILLQVIAAIFRKSLLHVVVYIIARNTCQSLTCKILKEN